MLWITSAPIKKFGNQAGFDLASARYRVLLPAKALAEHSHKTQILAVTEQTNVTNIPNVKGFDVIIVSKSFTTVTEKIIELAKKNRVPVIVDVCDNNFDHDAMGPHLRNLVTSADIVVVNTAEMAHIIADVMERKGSVVIPDPVEMAIAEPHAEFTHGVELLWFGHPVNFDSLGGFLPNLARINTLKNVNYHIVTRIEESLKNYVNGIQKNLKNNINIHLHEWSVELLSGALAQCHAVVIPHAKNIRKTPKSANRVTESLWRGAYVIANEIDSYKEFSPWITLTDDLIEGIDRYIENNAGVNKKIKDAQSFIADNYSQSTIGLQWERAIKSAIEGFPRDEIAKNNKVKSSEKNIIRLNLGCGDKILSGYTNVDVAPSRNGKTPDVICDLHKLTPFEDDSVDEILSVHVVEHFWRWEIVDVLKEWVRIMKPGGKMIVECPNLLSACEEFLKDPDKFSGPGQEGQRTMWVFYGDPMWRDPLMIHRWGYTPRSLAQVLAEAGLTKLRQEPAQYKLREPRDMRIVGEKPVY
ncbi:MAG: methyltransferase domain-containing protein [Pseudomonadota bacterium]